MNDNEATIKKIEGILGQETVAGLRSASNEELNTSIVQAQKDIEEAKSELKANPKYQQIVEDKKVLESSYRDLKKACDARTKLAIALLQLRGQ